MHMNTLGQGTRSEVWGQINSGVVALSLQHCMALATEADALLLDEAWPARTRLSSVMIVLAITASCQLIK